MKKRMFIDCETNSGAIDRMLDTVHCVCIKIEGQEPITFTDNYVQNLQPFLDEYTPVFHNASFDIYVLEWLGLKVGLFHDTMIIHYLLDPTSSHSLKDLGEYLNCEKLPFKDFDNGYTEEMGIYCQQDVRVTEKVFNEFFPKLQEDPQLLKLYANIELPFVRVIIDLETNGVKIDTEKWHTINADLLVKQDALYQDLISSVPPQLTNPTTVKNERKAETVSRDPCVGKHHLMEVTDKGFNYRKWSVFNPNSTTQVKDVLHLESADADSLEECTNPLATKLINYRKLVKLTGTYGETLLQKVHQDGRLRASFNQCVTKTGRLSSSKPNLKR